MRLLKLKKDITKINKKAMIVKLKCKFDLPETGKPCWNEEPVVFDGDCMNRSYEYEIIKDRRK